MRPLSTSDLSALSRYPVSLQQAALALWGVDKEVAIIGASGQPVSGSIAIKLGHASKRAQVIAE